MITIYHNPRCSKSREALAIAERFSHQQALKLEVVDYQKTPLTLAQLQGLHRALGGRVSAMLRDNEPEYAALDLARAGDAALLETLAAHPRLLQRPIVVYQKRAVIARPPQLLDQLFGN
jgi:arsenate reductase (glutaredoxin)